MAFVAMASSPQSRGPSSTISNEEYWRRANYMKDAFYRMMTAVIEGDVDTYKQWIEVEFPEKLIPIYNDAERDPDYELKIYHHYPNDGSLFEGMTPLQAAVFSGNPEMVREVLKLGSNLETTYSNISGKQRIPELQGKTARGFADLFIANSKTSEQAAPYKEIKKILLQNGAKPKTVTSITGTRLAFPENQVNINVYKRSLTGKVPVFKKRTRKNRKTRKMRRI